MQVRFSIPKRDSFRGTGRSRTPGYCSFVSSAEKCAKKSRNADGRAIAAYNIYIHTRSGLLRIPSRPGIFRRRLRLRSCRREPGTCDTISRARATLMAQSNRDTTRRSTTSVTIPQDSPPRQATTQHSTLCSHHHLLSRTSAISTIIQFTHRSGLHKHSLASPPPHRLPPPHHQRRHPRAPRPPPRRRRPRQPL